MAVSREFLDFLTEMMEPLGAVSTRRMFGGAGIYIDGNFIAIVVDDRLYLKTDGETRALFKAEGLEPFRYKKRTGDVGVMSYFAAPEAVYDDPEEMQCWARLALEAALRTG